MANFESLISSDELKWDRLIELIKKEGQELWMHYEDDADMLMLLWVAPDQETDVFYADAQVGLLVDPETLDVVGLQIEAFECSFLKKYDSVRRVWNLSDTNIAPKDILEFSLSFEQAKRNVAREIIRVTEDVVDEQGVEDLVAAFA